MHYQKTEHMSKNERKRYNNALNQIHLDDDTMRKIHNRVNQRLSSTKKNQSRKKVTNQLIVAEKERRMIRKNAPHCRIHIDQPDILIDMTRKRIQNMNTNHIVNSINRIHINYRKIYDIKHKELRNNANSDKSNTGSKRDLWNEIKRVEKHIENMTQDEFLHEYTELMYLKHELNRR